MYKVVYFDEGSATDFLLLHFGGKIEVVDEKTGKFAYNISGYTDGKAGLGTSFLNLIKASFSLSGSVDMEKSKDSLLKTTITNTLLTDFVKFATSKENKNHIDIFEGYKVQSIKNSFAFIKMFSPYIKLLKEETEYTKDLKDFNIFEIDDILKSAKGYYELLAVKQKEKAILRFNINSFRNSYALNDLTKMDLTYFGIKVGECKIEDLFIENEFPKEVDPKKLTAEEIFEEQMDSENNSGILRIYDILLAGITGEKNEIYNI